MPAAQAANPAPFPEFHTHLYPPKLRIMSIRALRGPLMFTMRAPAARIMSLPSRAEAASTDLGPLHRCVQKHTRNGARNMRALCGHPPANLLEFCIRAGDAAARITSISRTPETRRSVGGTGGPPYKGFALGASLSSRPHSQKGPAALRCPV